MADITPQALAELINHVFLPAQLPQRADTSCIRHFAAVTLEALKAFSKVSPACAAVEDAIDLVNTSHSIHDLPEGNINEEKLCRTLEQGKAAFLHIQAQNAGVLITYDDGTTIIEQFELSALNEAVMTTQGRLIRTFPGSAVSVTSSTTRDVGFQTTLANTISTMCHQTAAQMQPKVKKTGQENAEHRDTTHLGLVSELLVGGFLKAAGAPRLVTSIMKHTRDDVLWNSAKFPWRRSPAWLLIRVALQLTLCRCNGSATLYKQFMAFLMAKVLKQAVSAGCPSDLIKTMNAKLARRLTKLQGASTDIAAAGPIFESVQQEMQIASRHLQKRWAAIQERNAPSLELSNLCSLDYQQDTLHVLPDLDRYLQTLHSRQQTESVNDFVPPSKLTMLAPTSLPSAKAKTADPDYALAHLQQFEMWIASNLEQWAKLNSQQADSCARLRCLLTEYHTIAQVAYADNPEAMSVMLLTDFEIWLACDRVAVQACPLLGQYNPGIPQEVFQNLLLPLRAQMDRLRAVEVYLAERSAKSHFPPAGLFALRSSEGFPVKYFEQSRLHQDILEKITTKAKRDKDEKLLEFANLKKLHADLMKLYRESSCDYEDVVIDEWEDVPETESRHSEEVRAGSCKRCKYLSRAKGLECKVFEEPLPDDVVRSKAVVFELQPPPWFSNWRDALTFLLRSVLKGKYPTSEPRAQYPLCDDKHMSYAHFKASHSQRISLLSQEKPNTVVHYSAKSVGSSTVSDICKKSGVNYHYYDFKDANFFGELSYDQTNQLVFVYKLPAALRRFIFRPSTAPDGPAPNRVIASQDECPENMALEEYKELCTLPLGHRIQWVNLMLQLKSPSVDFKKPETTFVYLQCMYQTGPSNGSAIRATHAVLHDEIFAAELLAALHTALQRVKENWESSQALCVFITLGARLLSLSSSAHVQRECLSCLAIAREVALGWVELLRDKAHQAEVHDERTSFVAKAVEVALICAMTFDVDTVHLRDILSSSTNVSTLVQLSIVFREGRLAYPSEALFGLLKLRFGRLLHRACNMLASNTRGIDAAIQRSWPAYRPGTPWGVVAPTVEYWLVTVTAATVGSQSMTVHYNLLTGELLVNGLPLDRPPTEYEDDPLYRVLFGQAAVAVMPSTAPSMRFSANQPFHGYNLDLGMTQKGDLLVQTSPSSTGDRPLRTRTYETIPARLLRDEFPAFFVNSFVHFYDSTDPAAYGVVEFRPLETPWDSDSPGTWRLSRREGSTKWILVRLGDGHSLIGLKSETSKEIANTLRPLATAAHIHNVLHMAHASSEARAELDVDIPGLRLGFSLRQGDRALRSHQYREMQVDSDQSLDTLVGFDNKLMLRTSPDIEPAHRLVLILESVVSYSMDGLKPPHTRVTIDKTAHGIRVHALGVDTQLGRLTGSGSLDSKLYLVLLHALTTFCLPDPLIHKTGTEQALAELGSATVRSFDRLTQQNIGRLTQIAGLTPGRSYYPGNKKVMQRVVWNPHIPVLAQHGGFYRTVASIFEQAQRSEIFYPGSMLDFTRLDRPDAALLERDLVRSSSFRISGFGAEDHTTLKDIQYRARDCNQNSQRSHNAFLVSNYVFHDAKELQWSVDGVDHLWKLMASLRKVDGPRIAVNLTQLRYDAEVITTWQEFFLEHLSGIHEAMKQPQSRKQRFNMMMWLSTAGFCEKVDLQALQTAAALFVCETVHQAATPSFVATDPSRGKENSISELRSTVNRFTIAYRSIERRSAEKLRPYQARDATARRQHTQEVANAVSLLTNGLASQGSCAVPSTPAISTSSAVAGFIKVGDAMSAVRPIFKVRYENSLLHEYLSTLESAARALDISVKVVPACTLVASPSCSRSNGYISLSGLFRGTLPPDLPKDHPSLDLAARAVDGPAQRHTSPLLGQLVNKLRESAGRSAYKRSYVGDLGSSHVSLQDKGSEDAQFVHPTEESLVAYRDVCRQHAGSIYDAMASALEKDAKGALLASQFPRLSPLLFLSQLSHGQWAELGPQWQAIIVAYGLALTALQRAERILQASRRNDPLNIDLINELQNSGHRNWNPLAYPESLLIEVESGIMIRDVQESIASEMRDPQDGRNATMQLNMGQGKSSLIVPMVACALADRCQLIRVIVAKPQSKQMADMLKSKLGGAVGRRVYYMPFSRSLKLDQAAADTVAEICQECMQNGGVLLVQPEHILSFKLMAPECYIVGKDDVGQSLQRTQDFFDSSSRDIVDESDENFSVKFELIYTMGMQRPIESSPDRWLYIQQVLELVRIKAPAVAKEAPGSIEVHSCPSGGFPRIRILRPDGEDLLLQGIAKHICTFGLDGFPLGRQTQTVQDDVYAYLMQRELTSAEIDAVENGGPTGFWSESTKTTILLLRGMLGGGVLAFAFGQKRWRVNFGLASRNPSTQLSVPFRAKDSPTPRSEFSHPDVVIMLTSLCYYYGGLEDEHLFTALGHLMQSDQADSEYKTWVGDAHELSSAFKLLMGINLKDRQQCVSQLFPSLKSGKNVVDYFLSRIVFPKEMKEFPSKLSASGWDIGKRKTKPTTGFSGTNDSRIVLPLDVQHLDLESQKHTNALVLEHLLQSNNTVEYLSHVTQSDVSDAECLLSVIINMDNSPEVILDVGAQILEMDNLQVARKWLEMRAREKSTKEAVVFVNIDDELSVVDCQGRVELLQTSSFASRLGACLVFLDEAHTRGIDLKLPTSYRAAVTLGANLTKDRLVQACMRMRKLGQGQSVVFLVSEEIQTKIRECTADSNDGPISVSDVLQWAVSETFAEMHRSIPLWSVQGERYVQQERLWNEYSKDGQTTLSKKRSEAFLADEAQSIEERYRPRTKYTNSADRLATSIDSKLRQISDRCRQFDDLKFNSSTLQEEQERELSPEIEQERQIQKAAPAKPENHVLEADVRQFADQGTLVHGSPAYMPAFDALRDTSGAKDFNISLLTGKLMVTRDFARTVVKAKKSYRSDQYQRPVQWILSAREKGSNMISDLMIISPFEANLLISEVARSMTSALHLYKARCNSGYQALDELDLYTTTAQPSAPVVPRLLAVQLDLFAGQLYISSFEDYQLICKFLGLTVGITPSGWDVTPDGFIIWDGKNMRGKHENPVQFIKFLMTTVRRNGQGITKTDMGRLLEGGVLQSSDFAAQQ